MGCNTITISNHIPGRRRLLRALPRAQHVLCIEVFPAGARFGIGTSRHFLLDCHFAARGGWHADPSCPAASKNPPRTIADLHLPTSLALARGSQFTHDDLGMPTIIRFALVLSAGIQNIEHRAVGGSALRALCDRFRQDGFKLDEVGEFIPNARQVRARNLMHVGTRSTPWPS